MTTATGEQGTKGQNLHVVTTVNAAWNMWNFRRPLLESLLQDGHRVTVLAPADETVDRLRALGCDFRELDLDSKSLNPATGLALMWQFLRLFRELRPDVVLGFTIKINVFGGLAARLLRIPYLPNITGLGTAFLSGAWLQRVAGVLYRVALKQSPTVFFQNADDFALFEKERLVSPGQARVIPGSGIDLIDFPAQPLPDEGGGITFLMISRLLRDKGVVEYVEAARMLREEYPHAEFQLLGPAGSANRTSFSEAQAREWEETHNIRYLGACDDVRPYINEAHCVVLPSYREGAPRTLIEAAASARPLIASNVPGCRAVVDEGETGYLCDARSAASLAESMRAFLALSPAEKRAMGEAGRQKMQDEYDVRFVVDAYREEIERAVS